MNSNAGHFLRNWGRVPLTIYSCGVLLPVIVAALRQDLMSLLGVPVYAILFWTGPFVAGAAVFWSNWTGRWRAVWVVMIPVFVTTAIGAVFILPACSANFPQPFLQARDAPRKLTSHARSTN